MLVVAQSFTRQSTFSLDILIIQMLYLLLLYLLLLLLVYLLLLLVYLFLMLLLLMLRRIMGQGYRLFATLVLIDILACCDTVAVGVAIIP